MDEHSLSLTPFDEMTFCGRLQILKTCFPYLPVSTRRLLSSYIKLSELSVALKSFGTENNNLAACSGDEKKSFVELLEEVRGFCNKKERETIDNALNFMQAFATYRTILAASSQGEGSASFADSLKSMLTPEQQAMFDAFSQP